MFKKIIITFAASTAAILPLSSAVAIQYQGSNFFVVNGSGNHEQENWVPKKLILNGSPKEKAEVIVNSSVIINPQYATNCKALFIPIDTVKNNLGIIKVAGQTIQINSLPTNGNNCSYWGMTNRPTNFITRPDADKSGRFVVIVNQETSQPVEVSIQERRVVSFNACGFGILGEQRKFKRVHEVTPKEYRYNTIIESTLIPLPTKFTFKGQEYTTSSFPSTPDTKVPVCRQVGGEAIEYKPMDW
jgi:hypothetical protein